MGRQRFGRRQSDLERRRTPMRRSRALIGLLLPPSTPSHSSFLRPSPNALDMFPRQSSWLRKTSLAATSCSHPSQSSAILMTSACLPSALAWPSQRRLVRRGSSKVSSTANGISQPRSGASSRRRTRSRCSSSGRASRTRVCEARESTPLRELRSLSHIEEDQYSDRRSPCFL
jgi:hypothetical protein